MASLGGVRVHRPDRLARWVSAYGRFGATQASAAAAAASLYPGRAAVFDERGTLTFGELDRQVRALAGALYNDFRLRASDRVALMCRNHRGFVQGAVAALRLGCELVPLNTEFAAPQLGEVLARERVKAVIYDEEFEPVLDGAGFERTRILAWQEQGGARATEPGARRPTIDALVSSSTAEAGAPVETGRTILLTSGTTGTPKGAPRTMRGRSLAPLALGGLLDLARINPAPRAGEPLLVAPPLFHLFGLIGWMMAFGLGSPMIVRRRFDAEATLADIERHRAGVLLAVPTMLRRIIDLPEATRRRYDTSSLRMVISGAAPLPSELATAVMDEFGDVLYNGYASTEVGSGTLATPVDLRAAPGTVGRPAGGVRVRILDEHGRTLPTGQTGRIFVGSPLVFDGYTGGGSREVIDGLMSTGDVGHFDADGRLFIDGRDDDMILSGGENVYPQEVEELLGTHEAVADAAVFGVPDEDFGQRLAGQVVLKGRASVSEDELKSYVRERLARHKVPREITFVEQVPRTSTGKLQRRKLFPGNA